MRVRILSLTLVSPFRTSVFMTFSNPLFKDNDDLTSSDNESLSEEDVPIEEYKVYLNPLFDDDEINSDELESHVESNFVESLSNHDALIDSSQKIDYLEEFSSELAHINPEITESGFDFEKEIRLIENLPYDNSSPRPSEELNVEIANTIIESLPSLPIPVQDGDCQREKIDIEWLCLLHNGSSQLLLLLNLLLYVKEFLNESLLRRRDFSCDE
nr:hypothetical protein [Tanacetum cinerariifolium]